MYLQRSRTRLYFRLMYFHLWKTSAIQLAYCNILSITYYCVKPSTNRLESYSLSTLTAPSIRRRSANNKEIIPPAPWGITSSHQVLSFLQVFKQPLWMPSPLRTTCPAHFTLLDVVTQKLFVKEYKSRISSVCNFFPRSFKCLPQHSTLSCLQLIFVSKCDRRSFTSI
jgi:hypothetical protein